MDDLEEVRRTADEPPMSPEEQQQLRNRVTAGIKERERQSRPRLAAPKVLIPGIAAVLTGALVVGVAIFRNVTDSPQPGSSAAIPYDGPLQVRVAEPDHPDPLKRSGAAGRALECDGDAYLGTTGRNSGIPSGGETREGGLVPFLNDDIYPVPDNGYRVERQDKHRTLYSYDVDGRTKVAVIVAAGTEEVSGDGWGVETYAQCDPAEFAPEADDEIHLHVWTDSNGDRVPTTEIVSQLGPSHCNWESVTILNLGDRQYLRDPEGAMSAEDLVVAYEGHSRLPDDAIDTGYRLDEQQLWLADDKSSVYVVTPDGTERWPAAVSQIACM